MIEKERFIPTRASLLSRLKDWQDNESWRDFFETYWRLIYHTAIKAGMTDAEAQDVVQTTVISVMNQMEDFRYDPARGSFKSWLLRLAKWRIVDQFRKRLSQGRSIVSDSLEDVIDGNTSAALEDLWNSEWENNLLDAAFEKVKKTVEPRQYQIFELYVVKGLPVSKVAATFKISASRVYLIKHRVGKLVKSECEKLSRKPI